jgi:hypothetical protein
MNPRLGIAQDSESNWEKLVNHIQEHVRKLDLMSLFGKYFRRTRVNSTFATSTSTQDSLGLGK